MKKVISVVGARPNFMKVAPIDRAFKKYSGEVEHLIVHTGQHYDVRMSDAFFQDLDMPQPEYFLNVGSGSHAEQTAKVILKFEEVCLEVKPDLVIVVGDVNSTIAATLTAVKLGIKVVHVEGGLRSFDRAMPEEINRMATDAICDYCFVTEPDAIENLKKDNFPQDRVFHVGNTMIDSQVYALPKTENSQILETLNIGKRDYSLITIHRPSNVDDPEQLKSIIEVFEYLSDKRKIVFPIHPRTRKNIKNFGLDDYVKSIKNLHLIEPQGYIDFLCLMKNCDFVITDSGGIQEETTALKIPCLTIRTTTERPITVESGTNQLIQPKKELIIESINGILNNPRKQGKVPELWDGGAAERICRIIVNTIF